MLFLINAPKSYSITSTVFRLLEASPRASTDSGEGITQGGEDWGVGWEPLLETSYPVTWQAHTSPEPQMKAFFYSLLLSTWGSSQGLAQG